MVSKDYANTEIGQDGLREFERWMDENEINNNGYEEFIEQIKDIFLVGYITGRIAHISVGNSVEELN